jgi:hypothetical protein
VIGIKFGFPLRPAGERQPYHEFGIRRLVGPALVAGPSHDKRDRLDARGQQLTTSGRDRNNSDFRCGLPASGSPTMNSESAAW